MLSLVGPFDDMLYQIFEDATDSVIGRRVNDLLAVAP